MTERLRHAVVRHVVVFGRVLARAGSKWVRGASPTRCAGLDAVDLGRQEDVYWTLRQSLVSRREELPAFDRAFNAWFLRMAEPANGQRGGASSAGPAPERRRAGSWAGARRRRARGRSLELRRAPAHAGLRRYDLRGVRPCSRPDQADRRRSAAAPHASTSARPPGADARRPRARACVARDGRRPGPARLSEPVAGAAQAGAAPGHLRLDGGVLPSAPSLPARRSRLGTRRRDLCVRHAPFSDHARARKPRSRDGARGSRETGGRLVGRHTDRRIAQALQRRVGPPGADARRCRRDPFRRLRAREAPTSSPRRWRGSLVRRLRSSGSTR